MSFTDEKTEAQGHTTGQWQSLSWHPAVPDPQAHRLSPYVICSPFPNDEVEAQVEEAASDCGRYKAKGVSSPLPQPD